MLIVLIAAGCVTAAMAVLASQLAGVRANPSIVYSFLQKILSFLICLLLECLALVLGFIPFWLSEKVFSIAGEGASFIALAWIVGGPVLCFIVLPLAYAAVTMPKLPGKIRYFLPLLLLFALLGLLIMGGKDSAVLAKVMFSSSAVLELAAYAVVFALIWIGYLSGMDRGALVLRRARKES